MQFFKVLFSVCISAVYLTACQNVDFKKTSAGVPYKIFGSGKHDTLPSGSVVKYKVILKQKDSVLYSSYQLNREEDFTVSPFKPAGIEYFNTRANMEEILRSAKKGDSIYMVQSADSIMKKDPQSTLKKGEQLVITARVVGVYKNAQEAEIDYYKRNKPTKQEIDEANKMMRENFENFFKDSANKASLDKDSKTIEAYLASHNLKARRTDMGIYIEDITPGQGPKPTFKQFTNVKYKGMHLSGEVFDEGTYPVQIGMTQVVPGFMFGVAELQKGGKAKVYIPSILGYGPMGKQPDIKPNEILVFELELLDVSDLPLPQPQTNQPPTTH